MASILFVYETLKSETRILGNLIGEGNYSVIGNGSSKEDRLEGTPYPAVLKGWEKESARGG